MCKPPTQVKISSLSLIAVFLLPGILLDTAIAGAPVPDTKPTLVFPQFVPGKPIRLVAYGDTRFTDPSVTMGTNPRVRKWLAEKIADESPDALLLTGDTPFTGAKAEDWDDFQKETAGWRAHGIIQLPTTGNHEVKGGWAEGMANYLANFPVIQKHSYYSALLGSVEVISLDCNEPTGASSAQGRWFAAQLGHVPPQVEFLFILYHLPWMADRQSQIFVGIPTGDAVGLRNMLEARLGNIHARIIVFNGHIHNYERFERRGVEYVVTGGGGAEPYPLLFRGRSDLYRDTGFPVYHYLTLEIANHQLHAVMWKVKDPDGDATVEKKDEFMLMATAPGTSKPRPPSKKSKRHSQ